MAENTKKDQSAIIALIVVVALAAFFFGVYKPVSHLHDQKLKVATTQKQADALGKNISALQSLSSELNSPNSNLAKLKTAFPASDKPAEIIIMLNTMATSSGVNITNIQPNQQQTDMTATVSATNVTVTVSGDYAAQVRFSAALAKNIRPIIVNSVSLVGQPDSGIISGTYDLGFVTANQAQGGQPNEQQ